MRTTWILQSITCLLVSSDDLTKVTCISLGFQSVYVCSLLGTSYLRRWAPFESRLLRQKTTYPKSYAPYKWWRIRVIADMPYFNDAQPSAVRSSASYCDKTGCPRGFCQTFEKVALIRILKYWLRFPFYSCVQI